MENGYLIRYMVFFTIMLTPQNIMIAIYDSRFGLGGGAILSPNNLRYFALFRLGYELLT